MPFLNFAPVVFCPNKSGYNIRRTVDAIDAVAHSFSTVGTGGFSTRNASIGAFAMPAAEWVCTIFMFLASVNFALYCRILTGRISEVAKNSELRAFVFIVVSAILSIFLFELSCGDRLEEGLFRDVCFQAISVISSTGFMTRDYTTFIPACQAVIFSLFFIPANKSARKFSSSVSKSAGVIYIRSCAVL